MKIDPKEYLNHIRFIDDDIRSRQEEISRLRSSLNVKTSSIQEVSVQEDTSGAFDDRYVRIIEKVDAISKDINQKIDELIDTKVKVSNEIDLMPNRISRVILRERYINLKTLEEIADILCYEPRHVNRLHGQALLDFKDVLLCHSMSME